MSSFAHDKFSLLKKNSLLLGLLFLFVLLVNFPVINYNMMYIEQPNMYLVNQSIHSFSDLLKIYLHPLLLDTAIPFFRPSGHFLMYQIMAPLLGWHNTKGFIIVNLFFLSLTGFVLIKLYQLLFPKYQMGGYIAFALYLMAPALSLSRLITMHFEFAYVFFVSLSLYGFVLFCKKNYLLEETLYYSGEIKQIKFNYFYLVLFAMIAFVIAVTFKEAAIMLGPLLMVYLLIVLYLQSSGSFLSALLHNKEIIQLLSLFAVMTVFLSVYLTLPWAHFANPARSPLNSEQIIGAIKWFTKLIFSASEAAYSDKGLYASGMVLRRVVTPNLNHFIIWFFWGITALSVFVLACDQKTNVNSLRQSSLLFLFIAFSFFLVMPIVWAAGLPWHLNLSLLFLSIIMGFSLEYLSHVVIKIDFWKNVICFSAALLIGVSAITVNKENINYILKTPEGFAYNLNRNAVLDPPKLKSMLNDDSVLVVEDSLNVSDYALGNGAYPFFLLDDFRFNDFQNKHSYYYLKYQPRYNGDLFRWAYLMPNLKEELFPFQIENMGSLPNEAIHSWLANFNHIFCVGYDKQGVWHDRTELFKKNLLIENKRRHLLVNSYRTFFHVAISGKSIYEKNLTIPDSQLCQFQCDQDLRCKGYTFIDVKLKNYSTSKCHFYKSIDIKSMQSCEVCSVHVKT